MESIDKWTDNLVNLELSSSPDPEPCFNEDCVLGIDEAGRGPVLGPMVYGTSYWPISKAKSYEQMGLNDSKALSEADRERLFELYNAENTVSGWHLICISPVTICKAMLGKDNTRESLNEVSHNAAIALIRHALSRGVRVAEVYVDTVGPPEKYQDKLQKIFPDIKVTVSKKADSLFTVVSAASICAKVGRDRALRKWCWREGVTYDNIGSGYPGDATSIKFLQQSCDPVFGFPSIARFSWSTAEDMLAKHHIKVEWCLESNKKAKGAMDMFVKKDPVPKENAFFTARSIQQVDEL
ncbi:ribonuclease H2 subunit A-like [Varroa jacobsoni]|uniref:Ribonuclease n=1 Tax=Varroa destructor TaxID=109461 RepID=A0A7M7KNE2_VARDE|nr:ribonuclease H2 subunit A-like [Varroa destructor]XP_022710206.1 ribonuclease H2 subunit A-like [Varroa jacobsoni]